MIQPSKPFPSYKWRWLSVQPSEGLLDAPVFLGTLRALADFEGQRYSSEELYDRLRIVQDETGSSVNLARNPQRNLFRNSGQYWRGTGLIVPRNGIIELTSFGRQVAAGEITRDDFASIMVRTTTLPNPLTYSEADIQQWKEHDLQIKPLELILLVVSSLNSYHGSNNAFLTSDELIKIIIPLAGIKTTPDDIANALVAHRNNRLDISGWPDCAPEANDKRLAREFLLFLKNFEILFISNPEAANADQQFMFNDANFIPSVTNLDLKQIIENPNILDEEIDISRKSSIPDIIERTRVTTSVIRRNNQSGFRKNVLRIANGSCLLSAEEIADVLEAAHIIPVNSGGNDVGENGLCLRVDLHRLYDGGKIRISSTGDVSYSKQVEHSINYSRLPKRIQIPPEINVRNLEWREKYL